MNLALVLLATALTGNVDTTNLWTDIPSDPGTVVLTRADGKSAAFSALQKRVTVVAFYSSIRGDGRDAQALDALAHELASHADLAVLFVSIDMPHTADDWSTLKQLVAELKVTLPVWSDDRLGLFKWVNAQLRAGSKQAMPSNEMLAPTFVLIAHGKVVTSGDADPSWTPAQLAAKRKATILEALNAK